MRAGDTLTSLTSSRRLARAATRDAAVHAQLGVDGWEVTAYEWSGCPPSSPVLAFINGMEERWDFCADAARHLSSRYRTFSLELPWCGTRGQGWSARRGAADWIAEACRLLPRTADVLAAHSFGANALLAHLDGGAASVRAVVLLAPFYKPRQEMFDWTLFHYYVKEFARLLESGFETRAETARLPEPMKAAMAARVRERIGPCGWLQFFDLFSRTPDLRLERMRFPCLVVAGEHDFAATPDDCRALARGLPSATVQIMPGHGHFFLSQQPQRVASCIERFLSEHL